ncbi:hypothetical protein [Clostridium tagluense]|uniref:Uncharacterized protein n=1 Tax=Clostridium tagluense TaxID=360422 RepID=A0A401UQH9_9CLOT|nr:hypothetical protein [Clostridium tagluense]GCD11789.1 hypothetical protein Ctaglu_34120 [Clostridium tagluense]
MKVELTNEMLNNLMLFMDRIDIKGLKEIHAINEILDATYRAKNQEIETNEGK